MNYKTIVLELLQQHPKRHEHLKRNRMLLSTLEVFARDLKTRHEFWKDRLLQAKPDRDRSQTGSEALEFALAELKTSLESEFPSDGNGSPND